MEAEDEVFSRFLLPMLQLMPAQRATACKALEHPFLAGSEVTKAAKAVQKVRLSFEEPLHTVQDLRKEIAEYAAADQFLQKVRKKKSSKTVEAAGLEKVGQEARADNLTTEEPVQIVEDLVPGGEMSAVTFDASKKLKVRLSIEKPLATVRDCGMMSKRGKRSSEVMEASECKKSSIGQFKKTRRDDEEQGSEYQATVCSRMKSPRTKRKASKVAGLNLKKAASQSIAQGSKGLNKQSASKTVLQVRTRKFDPRAVVEGQPGLPLIDEILAEALSKVAMKSLVTGKALVDYVAKNYPEFGVKEVWIGKLKAALGMEVARGNLLLVSGLGLCGTYKMKGSS